MAKKDQTFIFGGRTVMSEADTENERLRKERSARSTLSAAHQGHARASAAKDWKAYKKTGATIKETRKELTRKSKVGFTRESILRLFKQGGSLAKKDTKVSGFDPLRQRFSERVHGRESGLESDPNALTTREIVEASPQDIDHILGIFKKREEDVSRRRKAPGAAQTRLVNR